VIDAMKKFASLTEKTRRLLLDSSLTSSSKRKQLALMMNENFNLRKQIFGREAMCANNLRMIELANRHGFAAKFTGSGGAIVGLWDENGETNAIDIRSDSDGNPSDTLHFGNQTQGGEPCDGEKEAFQMEKLKRELQKEGFVFCRVKICNEKYDRIG
ncbi:9951_t:CDS:1, partial [Acaulospora colombiana]